MRSHQHPEQGEHHVTPLQPRGSAIGRLKFSLCPTLDHALRGRIVVLDRHLARSLIEVGVCLHKHLTRLLVREDHIANLGASELRINIGHFGEELAAGFDVGSRLVDVELLEEVGDGWEVSAFRLRGEMENVEYIPFRPLVKTLERSTRMTRSERSSFLYSSLQNSFSAWSIACD